MGSIVKFFNILIVMLLLSFSSNAAAANKLDATSSSNAAANKLDATSEVICNIIGYIWSIGGPVMTMVIIGAALLAIFGRMPWPALVALGIFCGVFFGAKTIVEQLVPADSKGMLEECAKRP